MFWWLYTTECCITDKTTAECEAESVHASFAALVSGFFHLKTLFSKQSKWAELMHLMEIKLPSKSQAVFYEMQNELLALQQNKDTEKTCVCCFGAFCSHLTGLHSSLSWAEEMLKVWNDSLMENALLLSLPPWATAYRLHCEVSHRYLFLVLSCLQRNPCTSAKIIPLKSSAETGNAEIAKLFSYRAQTAAGLNFPQEWLSKRTRWALPLQHV